MTEEIFTRELERRAEREYGGVHGAPLSFEDVRGTAQGIRRRRRAAAAGAVAAAVAVAILVPTVLTGGSNRSQGPDPAPAPPTAPGASVLHDGVVTRPDGGTVPVDVSNENVVNYGVLTDGRVVVATQKPNAVRVFAPDGSLQATYPVQTNVVTMSADDSVAAWVDEKYRTAVLRSGVAEPVTMDGPPSPGGESPGSIDAVLDAEHLLVGDFNTTTGTVTPAGRTDLTTSRPLRVTDVSPDGDLWAVQYADDSDPQYGCAGLYDPAAGELVARSCETAGLTFSPDGKHLLGGFYENNMAGEVAVFDRSLQPVGRFESSGRGDVVSRAAWADATHVLVSGTDWTTSTWSLTRVGLAWDDRQVVVPEGPGGNPEQVAEFILSE
ncbi:hypothetical protein [Nocardioides sp.]|uniref:hypothetical protein n=1 Tax=Nocardioides sp. TaxID=35761 RepID=UPI0026059F2A|nr:hypothetical protein [Nocardioides sp.]MDI6910100.1 hypothetical protein [Nocardioides sp.]